MQEFLRLTDNGRWDRHPGMMPATVKLGAYGGSQSKGKSAPGSPRSPFSLPASEVRSTQTAMDAKLAQTFDLQGLEAEYSPPHPTPSVASIGCLRLCCRSSELGKGGWMNVLVGSSEPFPIPNPFTSVTSNHSPRSRETELRACPKLVPIFSPTQCGAPRLLQRKITSAMLVSLSVPNVGPRGDIEAACPLQAEFGWIIGSLGPGFPRRIQPETACSKHHRRQV